MSTPDFASARWQKSTHSNETGACVEVALVAVNRQSSLTALSATSWKKPTKSQGENACVEVASTPSLAGVRDSKQRGHGPILAFDRELWNCFVSKLKAGSFDLP
jgi:uncharacterized protein DUF397